MASICMGPTVDNQIVRELFTNTIYAAGKLKIDGAFMQRLSAKLKQLPPPVRVAKDGRVMEWMEDYRETEPSHRHISHLYGLYPASMITPEATPSWAEASKKHWKPAEMMVLAGRWLIRCFFGQDCITATRHSNYLQP